MFFIHYSSSYAVTSIIIIIEMFVTEVEEGNGEACAPVRICIAKYSITMRF